MEKYFRRLMRELCREDYSFDGPSVIYPGISIIFCVIYPGFSIICCVIHPGISIEKSLDMFFSETKLILV